MNKVYFTNIRSTIIDLLDGAEKSINVAVGWFTNEAIFRVILNKAAANKDIKIIISDSYTNIYDNWNQRKLEFEKLLRKVELFM
jgi:hypothetical protein